MVIVSRIFYLFYYFNYSIYNFNYDNTKDQYKFVKHNFIFLNVFYFLTIIKNYKLYYVNAKIIFS